MGKPIEVLDFKSFIKGDCMLLNQVEIDKVTRRKKLVKTVIIAGTVSLTLLTLNPLPSGIAHAVSEVAKGDHTWDKLVNGLIKLLDPVAKVFGIIAGIAIMTGNGKIGLERLFWLSIGYLTARKVELWINFLNHL